MKDVGFVGFPYTWERARNGEVILQERLDRGLANGRWFQQFPNYFIQHVGTATCDHDILLLQDRCAPRTAHSIFRFNNEWRLRGECRELIQQCWMSNSGVHMANKLSTVAGSLQ